MPGMGVLHWISVNWFDLAQTLGIVASLAFTGATFRTDAKSRRVSNLIELTTQHREIWTELDRRPELSRVLDTTVDLERTPVQPEEERFIRMLILHLNSAYQAMKNRVYTRPDGLRKDIRRFFSRPVAKCVWEKTKSFQDVEFVRFVESCLVGR
jgi:hypothetical protein